MSSNAAKASDDPEKLQERKLSTRERGQASNQPSSSPQLSKNKDQSSSKSKKTLGSSSQPSRDEKEPSSSSHKNKSSSKSHKERERKEENKGSNSTTVPSGSRGPRHRKQAQDSDLTKKPKEGPTDTASMSMKKLEEKIQEYDVLTKPFYLSEIEISRKRWEGIHRNQMDIFTKAEKKVRRLLKDKKYDGWDITLGEQARKAVDETETFDIENLEDPDDVQVQAAQETSRRLGKQVRDFYCDNGIVHAMNRYIRIKNMLEIEE